jgi:hypothetical protein
MLQCMTASGSSWPAVRASRRRDAGVNGRDNAGVVFVNAGLRTNERAICEFGAWYTAMKEEVLHKCLAPGESTPWHRDPYHRVTVVLSGDVLAIEYRDGSPGKHFSVHGGQADWDEPSDRIHRGVNVGRETYEEIAVFFLDDSDALPQPRESEDVKC